MPRPVGLSYRQGEDNETGQGGRNQRKKREGKREKEEEGKKDEEGKKKGQKRKNKVRRKEREEEREFRMPGIIARDGKTQGKDGGLPSEDRAPARIVVAPDTGVQRNPPGRDPSSREPSDMPSATPHPFGLSPDNHPTGAVSLGGQ